ncbi:hypothetical protein D3C80_2064790 [compost metagenome]
MRLDRHGDEIDQAVGARPDRQKGHSHGNPVDAVKQAVAQLQQMLHKRLLGAGQLVVFGWNV